MAINSAVEVVNTINNDINIIDGADAKILNKACREYALLKEKYESAKKEYDMACAIIKKYCTDKQNQTTTWHVDMVIKNPYLILDQTQLKNDMPEVFEKYNTKTHAGSVSIKQVLKR